MIAQETKQIPAGVANIARLMEVAVRKRFFLYEPEILCGVERIPGIAAMQVGTVYPPVVHVREVECADTKKRAFEVLTDMVIIKNKSEFIAESVLPVIKNSFEARDVEGLDFRSFVAKKFRSRLPPKVKLIFCNDVIIDRRPNEFILQVKFVRFEVSKIALRLIEARKTAVAA